MNRLYLLAVLALMSCASQTNRTSTQGISNALEIATKYDAASLRGSNTEFRNWWDVLRYDIVVTPNYAQKSIQGSVTMEVEVAKKKGELMQIDLQAPMQLTKIVQLSYKADENGKHQEFILNDAAWFRIDNTIFIPSALLNFGESNVINLKLYYEGKPRIAQNPPWDGGWIFTEDQKGRPWMTAAVQGLGASAWFPCKDYQGDEPDHGATLTMIVPEDLVAVANGRLWETSFVQGEAGTNVYTWEVRNPINTYNIIPYIGHYVEIEDAYMGKNGSLSLNYWVLDYNKERAEQHFEQVKPMLTAFEDWMGPYPFYEDGYKLVETPHLGMEHQSAIAYGNKYLNGYLGNDRSNSGYGNQFDFIIVHESGHEWFGNSITAEDIADLWIHEAFTTYSEVMYVEYQFGKEAADAYVQGLRPMIQNRSKIIGTYGTNTSGSVDMYYKGANILHTLRQLMGDESFKKMIKDMNQKFYHQVVTSAEIEKYIADFAGKNLEAFFNQYLRTPDIPLLKTKEENGKIYFKWANVVEDFDMPIKLKDSEIWIQPTSQWQEYTEKTPLEIDYNFLILREKSYTSH